MTEQEEKWFNIKQLRIGMMRLCKVQTRNFLDFVDAITDNNSANDEIINKIKAHGRKMFMEQQDSLLNLFWGFAKTDIVILPEEVIQTMNHHKKQEENKDGSA